MTVDFVKYTMFKSGIQERIEEGLVETEVIWKKHVEENGLLKRWGSVPIGEAEAKMTDVQSRKKIAV